MTCIVAKRPTPGRGVAWCLSVAGLLYGASACQAPRKAQFKAEHVVVRADSSRTAEAVALEALRAWHSVPDSYCDARIGEVEIEVRPSAASCTTHRTSFFQRPEVSIVVAESDWFESLWHEVFHARTALALENVPQVMQEGLAEYYGAPVGPLRRAKIAREFAQVAGMPIPSALFSFHSQEPLRRIVQRFSTPVRPRQATEYTLARTVELSRGQVAGLENSAKIASYSNALVAIDTLMGRVSGSTSLDLARRPAEEADAYLERIGVGSQDWLREIATAKLKEYSIVDLYWGAIAPIVYRCTDDYPDPKTYLASTLANLRIGDGEALDLEQEPGYLELVEDMFRLGTVHQRHEEEEAR